MKTSKTVVGCNRGKSNYLLIWAVVAVTLCSGLLSAQSDAWLGGPGKWSVGANWSAMEPPQPQEDCFIPGKSSPTVDLGGTCNNLGLQSGSTIDMNPGYIDIYGGSIGNGGTIIIEDAVLNVGGDTANIVSMTARGIISMTTPNSNIAGFPGVGGTLINIDNTIQGQGQIGLGVLTLENDHTIKAMGGTLTVQPNAAGLVNTGIMQAASGSTLSFQAGFSSTTFNNTGGLIQALAGGTVVLNAGTFTGGIFATTGTGIITTPAGGANPILNSVTNTGNFVIPTGAAVILEGSDTNTGTFQMQGSTLYVDGAVTLQGKGRVAMTDNPVNSVGGYNGPATLTLAQPILGAGTVGNSELTLVNQSTINATGTSNHLIIAPTSTTNSKTLLASSGATLELRTPVNNNAASIQALDGGTVLLNGGTIIGGTLITSGTGTFQVSTGTLDGTTHVVTNKGLFAVANRNVLTLQGTINNAGVIALEASGGCLALAAPTILEGTGAVTMTSTNCFLGQAPSDTLTNRSTIEGAGTIGDSNPMGITNSGMIIANQPSPLTIASDSVLGFLNLGTLTVNSGSVMNITGPFKSFSNGNLFRGIYSLAGTLEFPNAAIKTNSVNLTLTGAAARILDNVTNNNALRSLAINGTTGVLLLQSGASITTGAKFTNNGKVTVGSGSSFKANSYTQLTGTTTMDGTLTGSGGLSVQGGTLVGKGTLTAVVTSNGSITAGDSATSPGVLTVSGSYTQSATGVLNTPIGGTATGQYGQLAVSNGVSLNGTLNLSLDGGFVPTIGSTFTLLTGSAISGKFATVNGTSINSSEHFEVNYSGTTVSVTVVSGP